MKNEKVKKLVVASLFAALICVATMVHVPAPAPMQGYVHIGDSMVVLSALLLGPVYGTAAAGLGSMLADLLLGYGIYAPGTLLIKSLAALCAYLLWRALKGKRMPLRRQRLPRLFVAGLGAAAVVLLGYFVYDLLLFGEGAALAGLIGNLLQGGFGVVIAMFGYETLRQVTALGQKESGG
ncbi:MAG: ECF transporter S component [Eubacteriales bacterium]